MNTQATLPLNFSELFTKLIGKEIGLSCIKGRMVYHGTLKFISRRSISIQEKGTRHMIPFIYVFSLVPSEKDNYAPDTVFEQPSTKLFEKYHNLLYKKVTLRRKDGNTWDEHGELRFIGNDYFVVWNHYDNVLNYVHANAESDMIVHNED